MPFDPRRYPATWKTEIRPRILARDGHCCKFCGVADRVWGYRDESDEFQVVAPTDQTKQRRKWGAFSRETHQWTEYRLLQIILTVAHLDHGLSNHHDDNLACLCQRCHLNFDRPYCESKRQATKRYGKRKGQHSLF